MVFLAYFFKPSVAQFARGHLRRKAILRRKSKRIESFDEKICALRHGQIAHKCLLCRRLPTAQLKIAVRHAKSQPRPGAKVRQHRRIKAAAHRQKQSVGGLEQTVLVNEC